MARQTKTPINSARNCQCQCLFYSGSKDKNKIVPNSGKVDVFHRHKITGSDGNSSLKMGTTLCPAPTLAFII